MKLLIINGPNLNMLGIREPEVYGKQSYADLCRYIDSCCGDTEHRIFQSNHEGAIIDEIQAAYGVYDGIVINPGGYTHTSVAIPDALRAVSVPTVEVHLSDINTREDYRKISYVSEVAEAVICGKGFDGYREAIEYLKNRKTLNGERQEDPQI